LGFNGDFPWDVFHQVGEVHRWSLGEFYGAHEPTIHQPGTHHPSVIPKDQMVNHINCYCFDIVLTVIFPGWWFGTWILYEFMTFHILIIPPTDELIFFRWVQTTNQAVVQCVLMLVHANS